MLQPVEPEPTPVFVATLMEAARGFRSGMFERLRSLVPSAVVVDEAATADRRRTAVTVDAMEQGAPLIIAGRLPTDLEGGRVAAPDLLIRAGDRPRDGRWRYRPADVKRHRILVDPGTGVEVVVDDLAALASATDPSATSGPSSPDVGSAQALGRRDGTAKRDLLRLAHDWHTLDAAGHAAIDAPWVGVLSREEKLVWYRLDRPMWQHLNRRGDDLADASTLTVYDLEFAWRRDIAAGALDHEADPARPLPLQPVLIHECPGCPWRMHCGGLLEARQDASLLPTVSEDLWTRLHAAGLDTIPALAHIDDQATVAVPQIGAAVDEARARVGDAPVYLRRHVRELELPRADVEVDIDMENVEDGAYLWGTRVTDRTGRGVASEGYRPFVDWDPDPTAAGTAAFAAFWPWLERLQRDCHAAGASFAAYCWFASAENQWLRVGADHLDVALEVETFISSAAWIDLYAVVRRQLITGHAYGLKVVAGLLGFRWRDEDPGGAQSMQWWQDAVDPTRPADVRQAARTRLLAYNEDDVAATAHVREWLDERAGQLTSVVDATTIGQADASEGAYARGQDTTVNETRGTSMRVEGLRDEDIQTVSTTGPSPTNDTADGDATDARDGDAGDGDAGDADGTDADGTDADGTDADGTDADGTDADGTDADGSDGDATDTTDGDAGDGDASDHADGDATDR